MAGIIKANSPSVSRIISNSVFNFDDVSEKANGMLSHIREEALQTVIKAKLEADQIRRQAEEQGRKAGEAAAEKKFNERLQAELNERMKKEVAAFAPPIQKSAEAIEQMRNEWLTHWEKNLVHLATQIAARVIRREVAYHPEIAVDLIREALELASGSKQVQLHFNPRDCERFGDHVMTLASQLTKQAKTELIPDPTVTVGGCRITTEFGEIDQQLETRLARIEEELT